MACQLCGDLEEDHYLNEDGTSQGNFYSCIAKKEGTVDGKCGCMEYIEDNSDDDEYDEDDNE